MTDRKHAEGKAMTDTTARPWYAERAHWWQDRKTWLFAAAAACLIASYFFADNTGPSDILRTAAIILLMAVWYVNGRRDEARKLGGRR